MIRNKMHVELIKNLSKSETNKKILKEENCVDLFWVLLKSVIKIVRSCNK